MQLVVDYHHSLRVCGDKKNMSLPKIFFFLFFRETPISPWVAFRVNFRTLAYSLVQLIC